MLKIDLTGKVAFVAGIGDDQGYGWGIAKLLAEAGATIIVGTWVPIYKIFSQSWELGKFNESRKLSNGTLLEIAKIYPMDASFDSPEDVPEDIAENKRYKGITGFTISEVAEQVKKDFGHIDILVHSLANSPEISKSLLETSRKGYLAALSASSYSFVSLLSHFGSIMNRGGSTISLTYLASMRAVPGYGGGMSSAKAALESDTKTLAWEAGRRWGIRVNTISAGPLASRAGKAIGFIERMVDYYQEWAPIPEAMNAEQVGAVAAFLASPLASAITGETLYVDHGANVMGIGPEMFPKDS
ncbi:enoyl-acyl-carrier protein reductase [Chlamydia pneumoniae TW-183]|uniref:Enoyl-[acyl-carrier-protein] reductase [NADH] n=2 Tax=Chlamydia pneumoniae TaxID=83558 RepID=Q9Z8D7_CHLPN|nr:enoyl-[acyl-carrier-protein] reductase [Chlamydia pneumoniae]AAD18550.1 Enoyl-Acyl-Carrier Protein Reductase [Chlamydia pneumoniae CWL029]AAF38201.1 enoyl-(acyl-carrier protein) reductase [Chlamydia pneumoniae AR39]AAP98351.1 enoyl-acyl-carrier protein reductase [Chlamydia pneumoniae TW-183]ACZ33383.1 putative enoyl-(acyl-carrier-protein) reductase [Chlamydia pneumoniae LPCoLN]CRI32908.1 Enoyl-[acyl-carrier-protein] reductase [NADH], chloroplastic [Chlamydia pneumoniae]